MTTQPAASTPDAAQAPGTAETFIYLCTQCPIGCRLEVEAVDGDIIEVRGASCTSGDRYARQEHVDPRRWVSTTVALVGADLARLPVRTADAVPKARVRDVARALRSVTVSAPVSCGQVVLADVLDLGIDVIATRTVPPLPHGDGPMAAGPGGPVP